MLNTAVASSPIASAQVKIPQSVAENADGKPNLPIYVLTVEVVMQKGEAEIIELLRNRIADHVKGKVKK